MHGRSRMTMSIDSRIPTMPGRSTSDFRRPDIACTKPVSCSASHMKGELHPARNRLQTAPLCVLSCIWVTASDGLGEGRRGHGRCGMLGFIPPTICPNLKNCTG
ncbi:unnamed protein product, partial [Laminaria digitata]